MLLDSEQQIGELSQHMGTDGLALEGSRDTEYGDLVYRYRKVIRPELGEALHEWPVRRDGLLEAGGRLGRVNRPEKLRQLGDGRLQRRRVTSFPGCRLLLLTNLIA